MLVAASYCFGAEVLGIVYWQTPPKHTVLCLEESDFVEESDVEEASRIQA